MLTVLHVLTVVVVAIAMALALAHALELPGKLRLSKETYYAVQPIYDPGFTIGGISEPMSLILMLILLFLVRLGSIEFWLIGIALLGIIGMQGVYWLITHPVNQFWLQNEDLSDVSTGFFSFRVKPDDPRSWAWTNLRNRWEYSHVARAGFALVSLIALVIAASIN